MKNIIVVILMFVGFLGLAQSDSSMVEIAPEYPGGMTALMTYLTKSVQYPEEAYSMNIEGKVYVSFIIEKDGSVSTVQDAIPSRNTNKHLVKEAIRVVSNMPNWKPGIQRGKAVNVKYSIPINFKITESIEPEQKKKARSFWSLF
jgi:TonB family protein